MTMRHGPPPEPPSPLSAAIVTIERADNGWIVRGSRPEDGIWVYDNETVEDVEAFASALHEVAELLGMVGSRYDAKRVSITVKPGDKWEAPTPPDPSP